MSPGSVVRALRSSLNMSQRELAKRSSVPRGHLSRLEAGAGHVQCETIRRLFEAMFCELVILPRRRAYPRDAMPESDLIKPFGRRTWGESM